MSLVHHWRSQMGPGEPWPPNSKRVELLRVTKKNKFVAIRSVFFQLKMHQNRFWPRLRHAHWRNSWRSPKTTGRLFTYVSSDSSGSFSIRFKRHKNKKNEIYCQNTPKPFRPGLRPGPRCRSLRRSPDPLVSWKGTLFPIHFPFGVSISAPFAPPFWPIPYKFLTTPLWFMTK